MEKGRKASEDVRYYGRWMRDEAEKRIGHLYPKAKLPDGSEAIIETTSFVLPNGDALGTTGVVPDISLPQGWDEVLPNRDPVLDRAIQYLDEQK